MSGLKLAALYGLRPHMLGFCGPKEKASQQILRKFLLGRVAESKIKPALRKFRGAYPYYQLIAKSNRINDPFDERVVSAYWTGNSLLDKVEIGDLRKMIASEFFGPGLLSKKNARQKSILVSAGSNPHHSFHVLVIGSVTRAVDFKNTKLKDLCRIGWGRVEKRLRTQSPKPKIIVEYQPLVGEKGIKLGKAIKKEIFWDKEIAPGVETGDWISFHWGQVVEVLGQKDVANLKKYTLNTLKSLA